ncbi:hypothetical protein [Streptomyces sp. NRRL S-337]|uniref:hypothetical protein n=1 Tax=Streptomyces sp. NRRL S-337 TaxID=1463900 RepID=UPI0004C7D4E2|nr:hypothetical protein [Streptomyces sp. NRRL S-337]
MPRDIFGALGALVRAEASRTVPRPKTTPPATSPRPGRPPSGGPADPAPGAPDAADTADAPGSAPVARERRRPLTALLRALRLRPKDRPSPADGRSASPS